jgi:PmbA protein
VTARGATVAECVLRSGAELSAKVRLGEPELVEEAGHRSAGLRVMKGKQVASTSTSDLSEAGIERFIADAIELVELSQEDPFAGPADPKLLCDPSTLPDLELYDPAGGIADAAQAIAIATKGEAAARAFDPRITNSEGRRSAAPRGARRSSSRAGFARRTRGRTRRSASSPSRRTRGARTGAATTGPRSASSPSSRTPRPSGARPRAGRCASSARRPVPTCEVPVVFDPDAARSILGLLAGCVMGSSIWRKSSYLVGREGTRVASDLVSVVDDPLPEARPRLAPVRRRGAGVAQERRRGEGHPAHLPLRLVLGPEARAREHRERLARRGSGRGAEHVELHPGQPGVDSNEAIVKGTKRGLYVTEMMGFGFNAVTGDFSRGASGFWIEGGQLALPGERGHDLAQRRQLWQRIDAVGSDLDLRTSTASPTLRVEKMMVAGGGR